MSGLTITKLFFLLFIFSISHQLTAKSHSFDYEIDRELFAIPGHGEIAMEVPKAWNFNFTWVDENQPPLITFYILNKNDNAIFQLNMSVLWNDGYDRNITSSGFIRSLVKKTGESILPMSDETELILNEIIGNNGTGFIFDLTDSNAGQGEYKYLTQGAISMGELLLVFSLFSNDESSLLRDKTLRIITTAKHNFRKDV